MRYNCMIFSNAKDDISIQEFFPWNKVLSPFLTDELKIELQIIRHSFPRAQLQKLFILHN